MAVTPQDSLVRKVALITGASSGIGLAIAKEFAQRGFDLALCARRLDRLEENAKDLEKCGIRALALQCDVNVDADVEAAYAKALAHFGRMDVVVANAGMALVGTVERFQISRYRQVLETNCYGVIRTLQGGIPLLKKTKGYIAVIGSVMGYVATPGTSAYCMSKAAVSLLADTLRLELAKDGVSVTLVSPGFVESEIRSLDKDGKPVPGAKDPVPKFLVMPTQKAAKIMVRDILARRAHSVITLHAKIALWMQRISPRFVQYMISKMGKQMAGRTREG